MGHIATQILEHKAPKTWDDALRNTAGTDTSFALAIILGTQGFDRNNPKSRYPSLDIHIQFPFNSQSEILALGGPWNNFPWLQQ